MAKYKFDRQYDRIGQIRIPTRHGMVSITLWHTWRGPAGRFQESHEYLAYRITLGGMVVFCGEDLEIPVERSSDLLSSSDDLVALLRYGESQDLTYDQRAFFRVMGDEVVLGLADRIARRGS